MDLENEIVALKVRRKTREDAKLAAHLSGQTVVDYLDGLVREDARKRLLERADDAKPGPGREGEVEHTLGLIEEEVTR